MSENPSVREVRLGLHATEQQAEEIKERIIGLLCPDPDHAPPCPLPWSVSLFPESALDDSDLYSELVEQSRAENPPRP